MFYACTLVLPPLFVVLVWLFFLHAAWPRSMDTRALFVSGVSVLLSLAFASVLLGAVGRVYARLEAALRTVRRQNLQLRALHQAGLALNEELDLPSVLSRIVGLSRHVLDVASARLSPAEAGAVARPGDDAEASADGTRLSVPVRFHRELLATLELSRPGRPFTAEERTTAERFATRAGAAIANARLLDAVRELGGAAERERIARDLHDGTVQALFGLSLEMQAALVDAAAAPEALEPAMRTALERITGILREIRAYVSESAHAEHDRVDLEPVLRAAVEPLMSGSSATLVWRWRLPGAFPMPAGAAHEVAEVVREAVANAVRHADATRVSVAAWLRAGTLFLEVRDDGHGTAPGIDEASGLGTMGTRMHVLGGDVTLQRLAGQGTRVTARLHWAADMKEPAEAASRRPV